MLIFQDSSAQSKWSELDEIIQQKQQILGKDLVIMLANKDSLVYKKELGDFKSKTQVPIASASKWLTAALIMILVDEGKISLDDHVVNYIPEFGKYFKNYITVRHCLSHMTGIKDEGATIRNIFQRRKFESLEEEVNTIAAREIESGAGTVFRYNNFGLNIAGRIAEVVTRKKFDQLIKLKLFTPLGMRNTTFTDQNMGPVNPSGGARSTAEDYMKFLMMLLNRGKSKDKQIISESSIEEIITINTKPEQIKYAPKAATGFNYAAGSWVIEEANNSAYTLASPGLFGTWPMIDLCHGYAYLVFVRNLLGEERADAHLQIKKVVDEEFKDQCKTN